jgi:hypothetical protein
MLLSVLFLFLVALGFEVKASHLLGRHSITHEPLYKPYFVLDKLFFYYNPASS